MVIALICTSEKANYFQQEGLTGLLKISPSGKSRGQDICEQLKILSVFLPEPNGELE
jgi:hypothetical protein